MNMRATCAIFSAAAGCFCAQAFAGVVGEDVAGKDLALTSANAIKPQPIYLTANAKASAKSTQSVNRLGVCMTVEFDMRGFDPTLDANDYMWKYGIKGFSFTRNPDGSRRHDAVIQVLKEPAHGVLEKAEGKYSDDTDYIYTPGPSEDNSGNEFYRGLDHFVMSVSAGGKTVQIHYTVSVVDNFRDEKGNVISECGKPYWKISQSDFDPRTQDDAAWLRTSELSSLIATDRGASTSITLATNSPPQASQGRYHRQLHPHADSYHINSLQRRFHRG